MDLLGGLGGLDLGGPPAAAPGPPPGPPQHAPAAFADPFAAPPPPPAFAAAPAPAAPPLPVLLTADKGKGLALAGKLARANGGPGARPATPRSDQGCARCLWACSDILGDSRPCRAWRAGPGSRRVAVVPGQKAC
jgi:hypothetical protein